MQRLNHTSVSYVRILERLWAYRNMLKETLTLPVHSLLGKQNNIWFFNGV